MSNNVSITPGSGAIVATDEVGGVQYQRIKVNDGTEDSSEYLSISTRWGALTQVSKFQGNDAYSRLRVSEPSIEFSSSFKYDLRPLLWNQITAVSGTVTYSSGLSYSVLNTVATSGSIATLQTKEYFKHQIGKSYLVLMAFCFNNSVTGLVRRVGYFDDTNGIFLEYSASGIAFATRSSGVTTKVFQSSWNVDVLTGSGISSVNLDITKAQILALDFQWLGIGRVRCGFDIDGEIVWAHQFLTANASTSPYMTTPVLPLRQEQQSVTTATAASSFCFAQAIISEGPNELDRGYSFSIATSSNVTVTPSGLAYLAIRPKSTFSGKVNRGTILLEEVAILNLLDAVEYSIIYYPTLTASNWTGVDANSIVDYTENITAISSGIIFDRGYVGSNSNQRVSLESTSFTRLPLVLDENGSNPIPIAIKITPIVGNGLCRVLFKWREYR